MNTAALENMISSIDVTRCIAQELGSLFFDKIEPFSTVLCEQLIHNKYSSQVRKSATKMCAVLLDCTQTAEQRPALLKLYLKEICAEIHDKL